MIDPFIFSSSVMLFVKWARSHLFASGLSDSTRLESRVGIARAAALLVPIHAALAGLRGLDMGQVRPTRICGVSIRRVIGLLFFQLSLQQLLSG